MESCMCPRVSQSHSIFTTTTFFSFSFSPPRLLSAHGRIFLPPLPPSRSPSLFNENHAHSAIHVSLSLSQLSVSLSLRPTRLDTVGYTLTDSHARTHSPAPPLLPSSPPFPPSSLSPSLAIVRARMPPISVDRQCIHASSPSLYREQRRTQIPRVCARERCGERSGKGSGRKGGRTEMERDREKERGKGRERERGRVREGGK